MQRRIILALCALVLWTGCSSGGGGDDDSGSGLSENACGVLGLPTRSTATRIVDGTSCGNLNSSPVVRILLVTGQGAGAFCSGSMITSTEVLTAAHCVPNGNRGMVVISGDSLDSGTSVAVRSAVVHPNYRPVGTLSPIAAFNDMAVLHLAAPLNIPTLPIIGSRDAVAGDEIAIFGYGTDENGDFDGEELQSGEMLVASVTNDHIAANFNGDGSNTCQGDSGGPAVLSTGQGAGIVGLTSSGTNITCSAPDLSLFTNVQTDSALDFILGEAPGARVI